MPNFYPSGHVSKAPKAWNVPFVSKTISNEVLYLSIADRSVVDIPMVDSNEELIDLLLVNNTRIQPLSIIDTCYSSYTYPGYALVRLGVYRKLIAMLGILPKDVGIAFAEALRPIEVQKKYFDKKFQENLELLRDKEVAYQETCKSVSPFIDNIPTHATGAAIDMTLFRINLDGNLELLNMGMFDTIHGHNDQQETFSENTTQEQRENRLLLLNAAIKVGLVNYGYEWWHFSYGDKMWAYVNKKKQAIYGLAVAKDNPIMSIKKEDYLRNYALSVSDRYAE